MPRIRLLPPDVVNKIAAGEVVERPASVVKELVENALDAEPTRIEVELEEGGRLRLSVRDDGRGMDPEDARLALERHATSKLRDAEGLFHLATYGFRGEALPAIASVAHLTLVTRPREAEAGTRIEIEGGALRCCEPCGAPVGTLVEVRELFFATPARRKFLKRAETEAQHAIDAVIRAALVRPDVGFVVRSGGRVVFASAAGAPPQERIAAAIDPALAPLLLPVKREQGGVLVHGWIATEAWSAGAGRAIHLFVNGRPVREKPLAHAVSRAYGARLPSGRYPAVVLFLEVPPAEVDVNVHPQKLEVRFSEPRRVYDAVHRAIDDALARVPRLAVGPAEGTTGLQDVPPMRAGEAHAARTFVVPASAGLDWHALARRDALARAAARGLWPRAEDAAALSGAAAPQSQAAPRFLAAWGARRLLAEDLDGALLVLDTAKLHERRAGDELLAGLDAAAGRPLLFPATVDAGPVVARAVAPHLQSFSRLGVDLEPFGGSSFALKALPPVLAGLEGARLLEAAMPALAAARAPEEALPRLVAALAPLVAGRRTMAPSGEEAAALLEGFARLSPEARAPIVQLRVPP